MENLYYLYYYQKSDKHISEEAVVYSEVFLIKHRKIQHEKYNTRVHIEVQLSPPELSIMERVLKQNMFIFFLYPFRMMIL